MSTIRKLARSNKYQSLYSRAKEISSIHLFKNTIDFSQIQLIFLHWLEAYNLMYMDISSGVKMVDEEIIKDDLRAEAYLLWRSINKKDLYKKKADRGNQKTLSGLPSITFERRK